MSNGIFFDNGNSLAQSRIEADEEMALNSSLKTVTFKAPDYVVEAIDAFASHSGSTRSSLISDILTQYFAHAFVDFSEGYLANFNSDSPLNIVFAVKHCLWLKKFLTMLLILLLVQLLKFWRGNND